MDDLPAPLRELVLAALLSLRGVTAEAMPVAADAINEASGGNQALAAELVTVGYYESRFLERIQAGRCLRFECDPVLVGGRVRHRARSYFQILVSPIVPRAEWATLTGTDRQSVGRAASAAARILERGRHACGTRRGAFSYYAAGHCRWPGAARRARFADWVERKF